MLTEPLKQVNTCISFDLLAFDKYKDHKFVLQFSGQALVMYCRYSVLTHEILSFDLSIWMTTRKTWNDGDNVGE